MSEYALHCFAQSGNSYKPALMLELAGADWEPRFVDYFHGATRTPEYRAQNVMGEAPMLEHGAQRLTQSGVILDYLAQTTGKFGPANDDERREILRWLLWDNHKLTSYTATLRYLRTFTQKPDESAIGFLRTRVESAYRVLDTHLATRSFAVGERLTIADLSMCGYLFWPDEIGVDWADYPAIGAWLERIQTTPRWVHPYTLMPGHPLPSD